MYYFELGVHGKSFLYSLLLFCFVFVVFAIDLEVIKLGHSLKLKIKRNDWLLADTCPQAANQCALF